MFRRDFFSNLAAVAAPVGAAALLTGSNAPASIVKAVGMGKMNIPNAIVTSQEGKSYRFYDDLVKGKTVLINMFYAECTGICPRSTSALLQVQRELGDRVGKDIFIYSISLKPEQDTPAKLKAYAKMHGVAPHSGWLFLRSSRKDMDLLRERLGFKDSDPVLDADINQHSGLLRFGNDNIDRWSAYPLLGKRETLVKLVRELDPAAPRTPIY
jgi:protein SCO1/2